MSEEAEKYVNCVRGLLTRMVRDSPLLGLEPVELDICDEEEARATRPARSPFGWIFQPRFGQISNPFRDPRWEYLLFAECLPVVVAPYFEQLAQLAARTGNPRVWLAEDDHRQETVLQTDWNAESFREDRMSLLRSALLFDDTGKWGAVLTDDYYTILGGEPDLMRAMSDWLGGEKQVRATFEDWLDEVDDFDFPRSYVDALRELHAGAGRRD